MDYLQNEVLNMKHAVSTTLLSLAQGIDINEAGSLLERFWKQHETDVTAAYKCQILSGTRLKLKIVEAKDLTDDMTESKIYLVSTAKTFDHAILTEVAIRCRDIELKSSIRDLGKTGFFWNPLLDSDFSVSSQSVFGPRSSQNSSAPIKTEKKSIADHNMKREPAKETTPVAASANKKIKTEAQDDRSTESTPKTHKLPQKKTAFPFQKVDKATALKASKKPLSKIVPEKVVVAQHGGNDEDDEPEDNDRQNKRLKDTKSRENEMKNLQNLFNNDPEPVSKSNENHDRKDGSLDSHDENEDENEDDNQDSPKGDIPTEPTNDTEEPFSHSESSSTREASPIPSKNQSFKEQTSHSASPEVQHNKNIIIDPKTGKKMRYIKKQVSVPEEDEEGFTVMSTKMENVLVECNDDGIPIDPKDRSAFEESGSKPGSKRASPAAESREPKPAVKHNNKAPTKQVKGKQGSLLNFFNVKQKK